jgi:carbon-monoxide dehydrogenase large subunit
VPPHHSAYSGGSRGRHRIRRGVRVTGTDRALDLFAVANAVAIRNDLADDLRGALSATAKVDSGVASSPYGCHVAEVEIDVDTGVVTLARYDVGHTADPMILHG